MRRNACRKKVEGMDARTAIVGSLKFIVVFCVLFVASSFALAPLGFFNTLALESTRAFLWAAGVDSSAAGFSGGFPLLRVDNFPYLVQINDLCAAKMEIAVLLGIIFATFDRPLRQRLYGFVEGVAVALLLNPVRIGVSVFFFNPLVHDVLFRLLLVVVIVSYYGLWYLWLSEPKPSKAPRAPKRQAGKRRKTAA